MSRYGIESKFKLCKSVYERLALLSFREKILKRAVPLYTVLSAETKNAKENYPMHKSIIECIEKGTTKIEKLQKNHYYHMKENNC